MTLTLSLCFARVSGATPPLERAQEIAFQAHIAAENKEFERGVRLYREAYQIFPDQEFLFAIASLYRHIPQACEDELKGWAMFFEECGEEKARQGACFQSQTASKRLKEARLSCQATLDVSCEPSSVVYLKGELKGPSPQSIIISEAGTYTVRCGEGPQALTQEVSVAYQDKKRVTLKPLSSDPKTEPNLPLTPSALSPNQLISATPSSSATPHDNSAFGWSVAGGSAVSLGVGLYYLLYRLPTKLDERAAQERALQGEGFTMGASRLSTLTSLDQQAQSAELWGIISLGVSGALLGTSLYMLWPKAMPSAHVNVTPGSGAEASLQWSW